MFGVPQSLETVIFFGFTHPLQRWRSRPEILGKRSHRSCPCRSGRTSVPRTPSPVSWTASRQTRTWWVHRSGCRWGLCDRCRWPHPLGPVLLERAVREKLRRKKKYNKNEKNEERFTGHLQSLISIPLFAKFSHTFAKKMYKTVPDIVLGIWLTKLVTLTFFISNKNKIY